MSLDAELLEILACPACKESLDLISLPADLCSRLVERYRPKFHDEEPEVSGGLQCTRCRKIYPVVSDIPVMLIEEALDPSAAAE